MIQKNMGLIGAFLGVVIISLSILFITAPIRQDHAGIGNSETPTQERIKRVYVDFIVAVYLDVNTGEVYMISRDSGHILHMNDSTNKPEKKL